MAGRIRAEDVQAVKERSSITDIVRESRVGEDISRQIAEQADVWAFAAHHTGATLTFRT